MRQRKADLRKRQFSGLKLCFETMKKTSVKSHTKYNMYMYRYICRFLKERGALIRVVLPAEVLGADGLLSD